MGYSPLSPNPLKGTLGSEEITDTDNDDTTYGLDPLSLRFLLLSILDMCSSLLANRYGLSLLMSLPLCAFQ